MLVFGIGLETCKNNEKCAQAISFPIPSERAMKFILCNRFSSYNFNSKSEKSKATWTWTLVSSFETKTKPLTSSLRDAQSYLLMDLGILMSFIFSGFLLIIRSSPQVSPTGVCRRKTEAFHDEAIKASGVGRILIWVVLQPKLITWEPKSFC